MMCRILTVFACIAALAGGTASPALRAQAPGAPDGLGTLKAHSDLVVLHVSVTSRGSTPVMALTSQDFVVYEDEQPQTIAFFSHHDVPVTVGVVVDASSSLLARRSEVVEAGRALARASHQDDEMFTVDFNDFARLGLPAGMDFTSDIDVLTRALEGVRGRGRTALFDAIMVGLDHLARGENDAKYLVILSDGADNASHVTFEDVVGAAARLNVVIHTVGFFNPDDRDRNPGVLKRLARLTGGQAFRPTSGERVVQAMESIARDIRTGYTLSYIPSDTRRDGRYRRVSVELKPSVRGSLTVRTRSGYVAPFESESSR